MNEISCPRCGGANQPNSAFCASCGTPLSVQPTTNIPPPPPAGYYPPPVAFSKILGSNTKWALGLGVAALFCCGPFAGIVGVLLAKKDMDEIAAGRAPHLDERWAKGAFYLNIVGLVLFVLGICLFWGRLGPLHRF
jgi:hypothetical protein